MEEHRKSRRRRSLKGGRIIFNGGYSALSCVIRDLSETGARLQLESVAGVPSDFMLHFDDGVPPRQCAMRWKNTSMLGVEFK